MHGISIRRGGVTCTRSDSSVSGRQFDTCKAHSSLTGPVCWLVANVLAAAGPESDVLLPALQPLYYIIGPIIY